MNQRPVISVLAATAAALVSTSTGAQAAVDFVKEVKPILEFNCVRCHNPKGTDYEGGKTDVNLESKEAAFEVASTIVAGKPDKSKLYTTTVLADDHKKLMPPKNAVTGALERLTSAETETLKKWIEEGANWPDDQKLVGRKKEGASVSKESEAKLCADIHQRITTTSKEQTQADMKPFTDNIAGSDVNFEMLPIPGGEFVMGSNKSAPDEAPERKVKIEPFWMGKTEVTWNEYELFMYKFEERKIREAKNLPADLNALTDAAARPTQPYVEMSFGMGKDGFPAISMTQHAANKYCQWLSAKTGHFYRLPTEAEWEYAARAGTTTAYPWGDDAAQLGEYAWTDANADFKYQKVGKKKPNAWGLHDMIGNVWEWTLDQYAPYDAKATNNPWAKATKPYPHAVRGGSWDDSKPERLRVTARKASDPKWKLQDPQLPKSIWYHTDAQWLGFRVVRPLKTPTAAEMEAYWNSGVEKDNPDLVKPE